MKIYFGYIFVIFLLQGTIAEPLFFNVIGDIASNIARRISDTAARVSQNTPSDQNDGNIYSVPELFGNAMKRAIDVAGGFGQIAAQASGNGIRIGTEVLKGGVDAMTNVGKLVENGIRNGASRLNGIMQGIRAVRNSNLRNAIRSARVAVSKAQSALLTLNNISRNKLTRSMNQINETIDAQNRLKDWAAEQKSRFESASDETKEQANQEIDNFIQAREEETQRCSRNVIQPIQKLFNDTKKFEESNLPAVHAVLDEIVKCMGRRQTLITSRSCARKIRQNASKILSTPRRAADLKRKFIGTAADEVLNAPCIADTRKKIEEGKRNVQKKLDELLASDSASRSSTTESTSDSTPGSSSEPESTSEQTEEASTQNSSTTESASTSSEPQSSSQETEEASTQNSSTTESASTSSEPESSSQQTEEASTQNSSTTESASTSPEPESTSQQTEETDTQDLSGTEPVDTSESDAGLEPTDASTDY